MLDSQGNFRHYADFNLKDIKEDWKTVYAAVPQSRELTAVAAITWPSFEEAMQGEVSNSIAKLVDGTTTLTSGSLHPLIKHIRNTIDVAAGGTGRDDFRQKNILTNEQRDGLSLPEKLAALAKYEASGYVPSIVPRDIYDTRITTTERQGLDKFLNETPVLGPLAKTVVRASNYGLVEIDAAKKQEQDQVEAALHMTLSDDTKAMFQLSKKAAVIAKSKEQQAKLSKEQLKESITAARWRSSIYRKYMEAMMLETESGDEEKLNKLRTRLDSTSSKILRKLLPKQEEEQVSE